MKNETVTVEVPTLLYLDLGAYLRRSGDTRTPGDLVAAALKNWLNYKAQKETLGYQWKDVFLPDGTELRMRYRGAYHYASVKRDQLIYCGDVVSPCGFTLMVAGTVRNPWRDLWIRRNYHELWTRAGTWRAKGHAGPRLTGAERRQKTRRCSD
jgi:hypothetical protein